MQRITLTMPRPHPMQREVRQTAKRFNILLCGRRWGKTTFAMELLTDPALRGQPVAYFAPTYKMLIEFWRNLVQLLQPVTKRLSEQEKRIDLVTGGIIDMWSLTEPNVARGRKYRRVVIDEAAMVDRLRDAWHQVLRPTLADLHGDAWFLSTPRGDNAFKTLYDAAQTLTDWQTWQRPTEDNPHIPAAEIAQMRRELPPDVAAQELDAQFVTLAATAFLPSMTLWDACAEPLPPLTPREPLIVACDAGDTDDTFAVVAVSRHPTDPARLAVRAAWAYVPHGGQPLDQLAIRDDLLTFCRTWNVLQVCYDKYQLRMMMQQLAAAGVWTDEFSQAGERLEADKALLDSIVTRETTHDGTLADLREHLSNADRQIDAQGRLRIVKRTQARKIDLAVALSMARARWGNMAV